METKKSVVVMWGEGWGCVWVCSLDLVVTSEIYLGCQLCMSDNPALRNDSGRIEAR